MTLVLKIEATNAAFGDGDEGERGDELSRILRQAAKHLEEGYTSGICFDSNGNRVGQFDLVEDSIA